MEFRNFIQTLLAGIAGVIRSVVPAIPGSPSRFNTLLLLETQLAGFQFYQGEEIFSNLQQSHRLTLKRDPQNRYDEDAIAVYWQDQQLGHIPRCSNVVLAQMMDRGESLSAQIRQLKQSYNPWQRVELGVYWVDKGK